MKRLVWSARVVLFYLVFGISIEGLKVVYENQLMLDKIQRAHETRTEELMLLARTELKELEELVMEVVDMTGGPGWTHTIQNAIMQLDTRLDKVNSAVSQHETNFAALTEENSRIVNLTTLLPSKHLD